MKRLAFIVAAAALLVSAPRLALAFLLADGVQLAASVEVLVYAGTGVASGVVLTGGNIYLAHALAQHWRRRGGLWAILLGAWSLFLAFAVVLIAPALVYGLSHSVLAEVLTTSGQRWGWAISAALSVEILAAAAMAASVLSDEPTQPSKRSGLGSALSGAAQRWLDQISPAASLPRSLPAAGEPIPLPAQPAVSAAQPAVAVAPASDQPAPARYTCAVPGCGRVFPTPQALAAHGRAHRTTELAL